MRFFKENFDTVFRDGIELFRLNSLETSDEPEVEINIEVDYYRKLEEVGAFAVFCARDEYKLVGYSLFLINKYSHKSNLVQACQDAIYMRPEYRGQNSVDFIDFCIQSLRESGVDSVYIPVKTKNSFGKLLERKGFTKTEEIYMRRLTNG